MKISTIFMNIENSKTSDPHRIELNLTDKMDLRRGDKSVALSEVIFYCAWKNIKKLYRNNKFEVSSVTWDEEFELYYGSYSVSNRLDYFEYIIKICQQNSK